MKYPKLSDNAQLKPEVAKLALENFHKYSPKIKEVFHRQIIEQIKRKGYLTSYLGRKRTFFDRLDNPSTHREGFSYIPQTVVSDNQKNGMLETEERFGKEISWLYEAHDGCLFEAKKEDLAEIFDIMHKVMEVPIIMDTGSIIRERPFTIPIECESSESNWCDMEKVK